MTDAKGPAAVVQAIIAGRDTGDTEASLRLIAPESLDQGSRVARIGERMGHPHVAEPERSKWLSSIDQLLDCPRCLD